MSATTKRADYAVGQKIVHWLMAVFIMLDLFVAQKFGGVMTDVDRFDSRNDHSSLGTIVAALFIIRLYLRWKTARLHCRRRCQTGRNGSLISLTGRCTF